MVPSVDPCEHDALFESNALTGGSYTWKTNLPAGTQAMIVVDDDAGNEAWSAPVSFFRYFEYISDIFPIVYGWCRGCFVSQRTSLLQQLFLYFVHLELYQ